MRVDILALERFYGSALGEAAKRMAGRRLAALWPSCRGLDVLGLGYAPPYIEGLGTDARRFVAFMSKEQGAKGWPPGAPGVSVLGDETRLPFQDAVFDRVVLVHALEEAHDPHVLLRETWRVMAPEARLLVIAANRAGLWARADGTPFGHGRPYSRTQLSRLLADSMFQPTASTVALHLPPIGWSPVIASAEVFERAGQMLRSPFGGLIMMEAVKRLYASAGKGEARSVLAPARTYQARLTLAARKPES